jgi:hypothetical protein
MDMEFTETGRGPSTLIVNIPKLSKSIIPLNNKNRSQGTIYTPEFLQAYDFAFAKGITTMTTIETANIS